MTKVKGMWVTPTEFVRFAESGKSLTEQIATRQRSIDFYGLGMYLPNPDPVLKSLGKDIKVYRELRSDAHIGGCIRRRKAAVKALESGIDREKAKSRVAREIESIFDDLDIGRIISEALDAALYGYQPMEILWKKVGHLIVPIDVVGKPPEWFIYDENNQLKMLTRAAPVSGEALPPRKFLVPRQDATYDNPYGIPDLSMCFWPATFKKGGLKFWVAFTEKYGTPWVIGKHPRAASDKETDDLLDSLEAMVQDAVAAIPDDASIDIINAAGGNGSGNVDVFERLLHFCRAEISIALLGQNQTTEANSNRASAVAGLEVTRDIRDGDAAIVIGMFNQLIRWICELNFGDAAARPVFDIWEQAEVDKIQAERDEILTRAGAKFSKDYFVRAYALQESDLLDNAPSETEPPAFAEPVKKHDADAIDRLIDEESGNWQPLLDPMLAPLRAALDEAAERGETAAEFLARLPALLERMDADPLADELTRMAFTARSAGITGMEVG